jgi:sulfur relay (sulfurtransferase) DsrC/TusE family protein
MSLGPALCRLLLLAVFVPLVSSCWGQATLNNITEEDHVYFPTEVRYRFFIEDVANQRDAMRQMKAQGNEESVEKAKRGLDSWQAQIGISDDVWQTAQSIAADTEVRIKQNATQIDAALREFYKSNSSCEEPALCYTPALLALGRESDAIVISAVANLKQQLGEKSFNKLDAYVTRNWGRKGPTREIMPGLSDAAALQFVRFENFITAVARTEGRSRAELQSSNPPILLPAGLASERYFSQDQELIIMAIATEASHEMTENNRQFNQYAASFYQQYGFGLALRTHPSAKYRVLDLQGWGIVEATIESFKRSLGEDEFSKLDSIIAKEFQDGATVAVAAR